MRTKVVVWTLGLLLAAAAHAAAPDWSQFTDVQTVEVVSTDEDGGSRLTTVWIVIIEHQAYLRTAGTTWGDNVERKGTIGLRTSVGEYPLRAELVLSNAEVERVVAAFREKYGSTDALMEMFRFGDRRVFRLLD